LARNRREAQDSRELAESDSKQNNQREDQERTRVSQTLEEEIDHGLGARLARLVDEGVTETSG
jgi:hypothetical protein